MREESTQDGLAEPIETLTDLFNELRDVNRK